MKNKSLNEFTDKELAESFVFPTKQTDEQSKADAAAINELRAKSLANQSSEEALMFNLLQLRYKIEDYLNRETYDEGLTFGHFLKEYVSLLNKKHIDFAKEIDMKPAELSQIINRHRKPPFGFVVRLDIHSNSAISAKYWNRIIEKENEFELMNNETIWVNERKHVKSSLKIRI